MAARPTWKGFLKVSLVNIPVRVFPATDAAATISFNQLHRECGTRIQQKKWCPHCEREVPNTEIVKGYEFEKGRYVTWRTRTSRRCGRSPRGSSTSSQFTQLDRSTRSTSSVPYYLAPDGDVAAEAFAVMREGMAGKVGDRQARALRPRVPRRRPAARARVRDVHAADRGRGPRHGHDRGARPRADEDQAAGSQARAPGDRHVRGRPRHAGLPRRVPGGTAPDHRREDRGSRRSSPGKRRRRPRSSTSWRRCGEVSIRSAPAGRSQPRPISPPITPGTRRRPQRRAAPRASGRRRNLP